ncbi:MAG: HEAT repeat domain-containing protein [Planctomycetota bacterium]|nr:HEAT repeat domain-containing protein [Planctomycetota bacterium]
MRLRPYWPCLFLVLTALSSRAAETAPSEAERQAFAAVKSVHVTVADPGHQPLREHAQLLARNMLEAAGFTVAAAGAPADGEVFIQLQKKGLLGTYLGAGDRYTGAEVTGTWTFKAGAAERAFLFKGTAEPPSSFSFRRVNDKAVGNEQESDAPFVGALARADLSSSFVRQQRLLWGRRSLEILLALRGKAGANTAHSAEVWLEERESDPRVGEILSADYFSLKRAGYSSEALPAITRALEGLKPPSAVASALRILKEDKEANRRYDAAELLGLIGGPEASAPLLAATKDADVMVRGGAMLALGKRKDKDAVEALVAILTTPNDPCRFQADQALGLLGDARAFDTMLQYFETSKEYTRDRAAEALGKLGDPRAVEPLAKALQNPADTAHISSAWALSSLNDPRVEPIMDALVKDKDGRLRLPAVDYFFRKRDARCLNGLLEDLKGTDVSISVGASKRLGELGDLNAVDGLISRVAFPDLTLGGKPTWSAANAASLALVKLTGQDFGVGILAMEKWSEWWKNNKDRLLKK